VGVYGSGLRNSYDFTFHSNGEMYATENGLGVVGTFPDLAPDDLSWDPAQGCEGLVTDISAHNPGERPDLLHRIIDGGYYGHPNPSRDECIFFGGNPTADADFPVPGPVDDPNDYFMETTQYSVGLSPEPEWEEPMFAFGRGKSANGIIEYNSNEGAFCGRMDGDLLVTYWSQSDQIRRVTLSENGLEVVGDQTLIRTTTETGGVYLSNPLPITQDPSGRIYVGEFGRRQISVFEPLNVGLWYTEGWSDMPVELLDAGSAAIGQTLYAVGGKNASGHQRALYGYDATSDSWSTLAPLPTAYPAVENPAVVAHDGKLYVFGGSTAPFSGAVAKAAVYDPAQDSWTMLADMPTARGGATAQWFENEIYVIGGMNNGGESVTTVEKYNPAGNTWSAAPVLQTARDNPGSAVLNGVLYVFGGRTRSGGIDVQPRLSSVERFTPATGWTYGTAMPTGRRAMNVVVYDGMALVIGGERTPSGGTYVANEAFNPATGEWQLLTDMPVGRHGAVAGAIDNVIYVAGGGKTAGTDYSSDIDTFSLDCLVVEEGPMTVLLPLISRQ
jgi:N-acetylneuraminic acid mutarotase